VTTDDQVPPRQRPAWTRIDLYLRAMARLRLPKERPRTQPQEPRLSLSTLPFLALILALGVLAVAFAIAAWPGRETPRPKPPEREFGTAPPGWLERAEKEFRNP
jgi:hypothetical protein